LQIRKEFTRDFRDGITL